MSSTATDAIIELAEKNGYNQTNGTSFNDVTDWLRNEKKLIIVPRFHTLLGSYTAVITNLNNGTETQSEIPTEDFYQAIENGIEMVLN